MAILVLGGAGYIGSHMVDRLVEKGQEKVIVVDSLVTGHRAAVHPDAIFYQGDLSDQDFMRKVFKENPDVIDLSLGLGVGWKWVSKKGIVIEANTGYGKLLFNPNKTDHTVTFKLGLNLGYRF